MFHVKPSTKKAMANTMDNKAPIMREMTLNSERSKRIAATVLQAPANPRVITISNQKGGVGKTTTAVNLAAALANKGLRVLVVDLDPQGNASTALGVEHHNGVPGSYEVLVDGAPIAEVVKQSPESENLFCLPASINLAGAEIDMVSVPNREQVLSSALKTFLASESPRYDFVFIDSPPSLGLLTVNALVAASEVLVPIQCEYYALEGVTQLISNIERVKKALNPALDVSAILLTMFDNRTNLSSDVANEVRKFFPKQTLGATIPRSVRLSEAPSFGQTAITFDPKNSGTLAYQEAAIELAQRGDHK